LTHLKFGYEFNQPIKKNVLPRSLKYLYFGHNFNQPIGKNILPKKLKYLHLGRKFNRSTDNFPKNLVQLTIDDVIIERKN